MLTTEYLTNGQDLPVGFQQTDLLPHIAVKYVYRGGTNLNISKLYFQTSHVNDQHCLLDLSLQ